ncbi:MAG: amidohydrolase [Firmicutes bacterium]|nr:amidohydrolase [Bacillota bacterium]
MDRKADRVYVNGKVYTVDAKDSVQSAFCVKDDRFMAVGTEEEVLKYCDENTERIDLGGQVVLPGLIDSHLHVNLVGLAKIELKLHEKQKEEILQMVAEAYEKTGPGQWIRGWGWINNLWPDDSFPTKEELDAVAPDKPVCLIRGCGHASWVNSKAIELAGVDENTPDPPGGEYLHNEDGSLWGVVMDNAQEPFTKAISPYGAYEMQMSALWAQEEFVKNGLTSVHSAGERPETLDLWGELYAKGDLKVRIYGMVRVTGRPDFDELYNTSLKYFKRGLRIGEYDNRLTARCYKISGDGSLGARSAWMLDDYSDAPGHKSSGKWTDEQLYKVLYEARRAGFQISYHAIGDAANRQCLDTYERLLNEMPDPDHRLRIEHAQILHPDDIDRFAELGVIPTYQTVFMRTDYQVADDRLGDRVNGAYIWRTMIDKGNPLPNGTDGPIESINPFQCMFCAVSRTDENGKPEGGWRPEEAMTRAEALRSYTMWGAYSAFEENIKGSIERGKLADFVIVDRDIMTCPLDEMKDTVVLETVIGGETVYKK